MNLPEGTSLVNVRICDDNDDVMLVTAMGRAAVTLVLEQIRRRRQGRTPEATHQVMKFSLVKRHSSSAPR